MHPSISLGQIFDGRSHPLTIKAEYSWSNPFQARSIGDLIGLVLAENKADATTLDCDNVVICNDLRARITDQGADLKRIV